VEIAGLGPVSVDCVKELMNDAFIAAVLMKGADVARVAHLGRHFTAKQRTALQAVVPQGCTNIACNQTVALELDHREPWADTHTTRVTSADWLCKHDHDLKTHHGYRLAPGAGRRPFLAPDDPDPPPEGGSRDPTTPGIGRAADADRSPRRHRAPPPPAPAPDGAPIKSSQAELTLR
jgi:hypothetical protein